MAQIIHRTLKYPATIDAASEPLTLDELKAHARIVGSDDDALVTMYLKACRRTLEQMLGLSFINTTWDEYHDDLPGGQMFDAPITLLRAPVSSIVSLQYVDTAGNTKNMVEGTDFYVDYISKPARLMPIFGTIWPITRRVLNAVHIQYVAGYGAAEANVPEDLRHLLMIFFAMAWEERLPITGIAKDEVPVPTSFRQLIANNAMWGF